MILVSVTATCSAWASKCDRGNTLLDRHEDLAAPFGPWHRRLQHVLGTSYHRTQSRSGMTAAVRCAVSCMGMPEYPHTQNTTALVRPEDSFGVGHFIDAHFRTRLSAGTPTWQPNDTLAHDSDLTLLRYLSPGGGGGLHGTKVATQCSPRRRLPSRGRLAIILDCTRYLSVTCATRHFPPAATADRCTTLRSHDALRNYADSADNVAGDDARPEGFLRPHGQRDWPSHFSSRSRAPRTRSSPAAGQLVTQHGA